MSVKPRSYYREPMVFRIPAETITKGKDGKGPADFTSVLRLYIVPGAYIVPVPPIMSQSVNTFVAAA